MNRAGLKTVVEVDNQGNSQRVWRMRRIPTDNPHQVAASVASAGNLHLTLITLHYLGFASILDRAIDLQEKQMNFGYDLSFYVKAESSYEIPAAALCAVCGATVEYRRVVY